MRKKVGIIKRRIAAFLIVALSINSFGAIVSDNDGSAFITKSEFDALKSNFQNQINTYNQSIDSKIDGAISAYLNGIKISNDTINYWDRLENSIGDSLWFANTFSVSSGPRASTVGTDSIETERGFNIERHYTYTASKFRGVAYKWNGGVGYGIAKDGWAGTGSDPNWAQTALVFFEQKGSGYQQTYGQTLQDTAGSHNGWADSTENRNVTSIVNMASSTKNGTGSTWGIRKRSDGNYVLDVYYKQFWPVQFLTAQYHTYKDFSVGSDVTKFLNLYGQDQGLQDTSSYIVDLDNDGTLKTWSSGTRQPDDSTSSSSIYYKFDQYFRTADNGVFYNNKQYGTDVNTVIYTVDEQLKPTKSGSQTSVSAVATSFTDVYVTSSGGVKQTNSLGGVGLKYYEISIAPIARYPYSFVQETVSNVVGQLTFLGEGCPLFEVPSDEQNVKITLKFKEKDLSDNIVTSSGSATCNYAISDKKFSKGGLSADAIQIATGTVKPGEEVNLDLVLKKGIYWINMYDTQSGYECTLGEFKCR